MGPLNIVFLILRYYTFLALGILAWVAFWEGDDMKQCGHMVYLLPYMVCWSVMPLTWSNKLNLVLVSPAAFGFIRSRQYYRYCAGLRYVGRGQAHLGPFKVRKPKQKSPFAGILILHAAVYTSPR